MVSVLFVCLGNICRSPAAEGIFNKMLEETGLSDQVEVDSAGTSDYNLGSPADSRMQVHARERGYSLSSRARQFDRNNDYDCFDYIITMDEYNYSDVLGLAPNEKMKAKVIPMVDFCKIHDVTCVPDPYRGGDNEFRLVLDILEDGCKQLLSYIQKRLRESR